MKTYTVLIEREIMEQVKINVQANSKEEAEELALNQVIDDEDGLEFEFSDWCGDFVVGYSEEVTA